MIRANFISARGTWQATPADTVVLDFEDRQRRRLAMKGVRGLEFLLDLPVAVTLSHGDALVLEDGRLVEVVAAPEPLAELRCGAPRDLIRLAWHLGNRHLAVQILANRIRIRRDPVIEDMARGLGAKVTPIEAAFDPEGGAYAAGAETRADTGSDHAHGHDHGPHDHAHAAHDHHAHDDHDHDHEHGHHRHGHDHHHD
jgi:urease accessory protein